MQFIEVRRIALGNVEGIKTLINLEHVRYIEEGSGCLYVYFKEDSVPLKIDMEYGTMCSVMEFIGGKTLWQA